MSMVLCVLHNSCRGLQQIVLCHWCKVILHFEETLGSGDVAKLAECLTSTCKALGLIPALHKLPMAIYAYNIALGKWKQDDQKLMVILNYRVSLRQVWEIYTYTHAHTYIHTHAYVFQLLPERKRP